MRPFLRFVLVILLVAVVVGILYKVTTPHISKSSDPQSIPSYEDVVPQGFSALGTKKFLDARDAGPLLSTNRQLRALSQSISEGSCEGKASPCDAKAQYQWVKNHIEFQERLPTRDHVISPEETILYRQGDSTTMSILLAALLRGIGYDAHVGLTTYQAFVEARIDGRAVRLDPACGGCRFGTVRYEGPEDRITWIG